jgi:DNA-binding response OmpR family regulator
VKQVTDMSSKLADADTVQGRGVPGVTAEREPGLMGHEPTVLLIEDDQAVSRMVGRLLRSGGYRVVTAERGSDSLQLFDDADIDIVLVDIVLPDMSGLQVAALINEKHPDTPVIFATAVGNVGELKGIQENRLLRKPFNESELFDKIAAAMKYESK